MDAKLIDQDLGVLSEQERAIWKWGFLHAAILYANSDELVDIRIQLNRELAEVRDEHGERGAS